jgi:hypothetical protein
MKVLILAPESKTSETAGSADRAPGSLPLFNKLSAKRCRGHITSVKRGRKNEREKERERERERKSPILESD